MNENTTELGVMDRISNHIKRLKTMQDVMDDIGVMLRKINDESSNYSFLKRLDGKIKQAMQLSSESRNEFYANRPAMRTLAGLICLSIIGVIFAVYSIISLVISTNVYAVAMIVFAWALAGLAVKLDKLKEQAQFQNIVGMQRSVTSLLVGFNETSTDDNISFTENQDGTTTIGGNGKPIINITESNSSMVGSAISKPIVLKRRKKRD